MKKDSLRPDMDMIRLGLSCRCPRCRKGDLYTPGLMSATIRDACPACGLDFKKSDSADGPAVFLIFILGFALVPLALIVDAAFSLPLWLHGILWGVIALGLTVGMLRPIKAYIIALQYKHLPWDKDKEG